MSDGGKGSSPRPYSVTNDEYANRWDAIFAREKQEQAPNVLVEVKSLDSVNGSTTVSKTASEGSNPSRDAKVLSR